MTKEEYKQMCQSHGLSMVSDIKAVGWEHGYFVVVQYAGKNNISVSLPTQKDDQSNYSKQLKAELKSRLGKNASAAWGDGFLTMFVNSKNIPDVYCQGVTAVLETLKNVGFTASDKCSMCGQSGCDTATPKGAAYAPVHRSCLEKAVSGAQNAADKNTESGSYVLGILGAFLGMLVGILPTVFSILALSRIYVLLFMLIPIASYAGYRLFKGRMNYTALVLSILFSILGVFLLNYINLLWATKEYYELTFGQMMGLAIPALRDELFLKDVVSSENFFKCLVFVALGIFLAWGQISRTSKSDVKDAQGVLNSAVPYSAAPAEFSYDPSDYMPDTHSDEE